jgi:hypothetical protein
LTHFLWPISCIRQHHQLQSQNWTITYGGQRSALAGFQRSSAQSFAKKVDFHGGCPLPVLSPQRWFWVPQWWKPSIYGDIPSNQWRYALAIEPDTVTNNLEGFGVPCFFWRMIPSECISKGSPTSH